MKTLFVIIAIISSFIQLSAQEIGFYTTYSSSSFNKFQNNSGLGITYTQVLKSNQRIGVKTQYSFCSSDYDEVYGSNEDGVSTYIKKTDPDNQRLLLSVDYAFGIIQNTKSALYLGPEIGINYFYIDEHVRRLENEHISAADYQSKYTEDHKFSFGFLVEFELKEVISKQWSIYSSIHPEMVVYQKSGMDGGYSPSLISWLNFNLGVKYKLHAM